MDISIIIPTYNRKLKLQSCLDSLFSQTYPLNSFEIIVVDDGSTDGTKDMLGAFAKINSNFRYLIQAHKGPAVARNLGIKQAQAEIIGFTDSDCILDKDWISKMIQAHRLQEHIAAIGGATEVDTHNIKAKVSQFLSDGAMEAKINGKPETIFFPTCNVSFKRDYLVDGFSELFPLPAGEDLDFFWRLFKKGNRFSYALDIRVFHDCHTNLVSFLKQAYMYGRGNYLVKYMHNDHPLLKELNTENSGTFIFGLIKNFVKIPRFSCLLGRRLIKQNNIDNIYEKFSIYIYFMLHKIFYLFGNILEFIRIKKENLSAKKQDAYCVPGLLILDITHSCNLHCRICDIWKTAETEKDIDIYFVKKMLFQAKELQVKEIALSGGEPLLRKDIFEIFGYARKLKITNLGVLTNGILVKQYLDRLKPYLVDNTICLVISLDSLKFDLHNQIRNSNCAWQETLEALRMLSGLKKIYPEVSFNIIAIILNQNLEELLDLVNFVKSLEANSLQFQALLPNNLIMAERKKSMFWVAEERFPVLDAAIDRLIEFKKINPSFLRNSNENLLFIKKYYRGRLSCSDIKCLSASETILTSNQGYYVTCFRPYGDAKIEDLKDVLKSENLARAQEEVRRCSWPCLLPCFCD